MAQVNAEITVTVRFTQREYRAVTQALAVVAGVKKVTPKPEDVEFAAELNQRLLGAQASELRQRLGQVEGKIALAQDAEVAEPIDQLADEATKQPIDTTAALLGYDYVKPPKDRRNG